MYWYGNASFISKYSERTKMIQHVVRKILLITIMAIVSSATADDEFDAHKFAAHAIALRSSGIAGGTEIVEAMSVMPGVGIVDEVALPIIWSEFFKNAIVKLGRLSSPAPVALYYNPLLDTMVLTLWEKQGADYRITSMRALLGENSADRDSATSLAPSWMIAEDGPIDALIRVTNMRLKAFGRSHPAKSIEAGQDDISFAVAAADFRATLPRLVWHASQSTRWTLQPEAWLTSVSNEVEKTLAAKDVEALMAAAPATDLETSTTLAKLPDGFVTGLTLDMVLDIGKKKHLLIGSMPEDGDLYIFVLCRMEESECMLERFALVSLLE